MMVEVLVSDLIPIIRVIDVLSTLSQAVEPEDRPHETSRVGRAVGSWYNVEGIVERG